VFGFVHFFMILTLFNCYFNLSFMKEKSNKDLKYLSAYLSVYLSLSVKVYMILTHFHIFHYIKEKKLH